MSRYFRKNDTGYKEVKLSGLKPPKEHKNSEAAKRNLSLPDLPEKRQKVNQNSDGNRSLGVPLVTKLTQFATKDISIDPTTSHHTSGASSTARESKAYTQAENLSEDKVKRKLTPLEEQVIELKREHPGILLMIVCGYRYRFFGDDDANIASKVLDIR